MKRLALLIGISTISTILFANTALADKNAPDMWHGRPVIVGTWLVEVTVRFDGLDCTKAAPVPFGPNPFPSLYTFHAGGTISETGSRSPPSRRSPGHGVWKRTGNNKYKGRNTFQGFDENGFLSTNMDIRSDFELSRDGSTFVGVSRFLFTDPSGMDVPFCATLDGVRYEL